jgi:hypothetical protein
LNMPHLVHSEKAVSIIYVGPKAVKRDTVSGYKPVMVFKRYEPTETPFSVAQSLLGFDCFVRADSDALKAAKEQEELEAKAAQEQAEAKVKAEAEEKNKADTVVHVDGEDVDLCKYTSNQLATFAEAQDLEIKQEPQEKVDEFRLRVRDTYRAKEQAGE